MKPKLIAVSFAAALTGISAAPLYAGPLDKNEVAAMAYVSLPFGGVSRSQEAPILALPSITFTASKAMASVTTPRCSSRLP